VAHAHEELLQEEEEVKASDRGTAGTGRGRYCRGGGATEEGHCQSWSCKSLCKTILVRQGDKAAETVGGHKSSWNGDDNACTSVRSPPHLLDSRLCLLNCQVPSRVCLWAGRGFARPTRVRVKTKKRRLCVVYSSCKGSIHHAKAKRGCHVFARVAGSACAQLNQRRRGPARVERDWRSRAFSDVDSNQLSLRRVYTGIWVAFFFGGGALSVAPGRGNATALSPGPSSEHPAAWRRAPGWSSNNPMTEGARSMRS